MTVFSPRTITIEASSDAIWEFDLDTWEGEQFDCIHDVISVERDGDDTVFTTCRTIERPDRPVWRIPTKHIESMRGLPETA